MWDLGNSESSSADSGATTYSSTGYKTIELAITDRHKCFNTIIGKVNVIDGPQANFVLPDSVTYNDEITVDLSGVSGGADFYWLSDNDTLSTSLLPKIIGDKAGEICYTLTVISPIGCVITNEECVIVEGEPLKLPNLFTPNGDGYNDELKVLNSDGKVVSIVIYNRWGELVFQEEHYQNDWAGLSRSGRSLSSGTYFVVMKDKSKVDSEPVNGFVHLTK
jgi:gliding motility-associated-like protein